MTGAVNLQPGIELGLFLTGSLGLGSLLPVLMYTLPAPPFGGGQALHACLWVPGTEGPGICSLQWVDFHPGR